MKSQMALSLSMLAFTAFAHAAPTVVPAQFDSVYVANGFDSNDNLQFVGTGLFPSSCYRPADTAVQVDREKKEITVTPMAYQYSGVCLQVVLPFERVIETGPVPAGTYRILQAGKQLGEVVVRPALTDSPDDHLYAPVSQALFRSKNGGGEIVISGEYPTDCMSIDRVEVDVQKNVLVVMPIVAVEHRQDCAMGYYPFTKVTKIDSIPKGRFLLHVRAMNANGINSMVLKD